MSLFDKDEALGRLNDLIKVGEVSSIDPATGTARVVLMTKTGRCLMTSRFCNVTPTKPKIFIV